MARTSAAAPTVRVASACIVATASSCGKLLYDRAQLLYIISGVAFHDGDNILMKMSAIMSKMLVSRQK